MPRLEAEMAIGGVDMAGTSEEIGEVALQAAVGGEAGDEDDGDEGEADPRGGGHGGGGGGEEGMAIAVEDDGGGVEVEEGEDPREGGGDVGGEVHVVHDRRHEEPGGEEDADDVLGVAEIDVDGTDEGGEAEVEEGLDGEPEEEKGPGGGEVLGGGTEDEEGEDGELDEQGEEVGDEVGGDLGDGKDFAGEGDFLDQIAVADDASHAALDALDGELPGEDADEDVLQGDPSGEEAEEDEIDEGHEEGGEDDPEEPEDGTLVALLEFAGGEGPEEFVVREDGRKEGHEEEDTRGGGGREAETKQKRARGRLGLDCTGERPASLRGGRSRGNREKRGKRGGREERKEPGRRERGGGGFLRCGASGEGRRENEIGKRGEMV